MEEIWLSLQPHLKATYGLSFPICQTGRKVQRARKDGTSQTKPRPGVGTVKCGGAQGPLCPTSTGYQRPQPFPIAPWQGTIPRADSPIGKTSLPQTPAVPWIQHTATPRIWTCWDLLCLLPGGPDPGTGSTPAPHGTQMGKRGYSPGRGKGRKGPLCPSAAVLTPSPPAASSSSASVPSSTPSRSPSPHSAPNSPGDKGQRDRPPTGSRHSRRGCERAEGRGHMTGTPAPLAVASPHSSHPASGTSSALH